MLVKGQLSMRRLPPLNAVFTFAAAARRSSFLEAARELQVTPAAVSRSVKDLERHLGVKLFERRHQGVEPTAAGRLYLQRLGGAFEQIEAATRAVIASRTAAPLHVAAFPSIVMHGLIPRWDRFRAAHPGIEVRFRTLRAPLRNAAEFRREGVDAAIFTRTDGIEDLVCEPVFEGHLVPVCSPALLEGPRPLSRPRDLRHHTLLHAMTRPDDWRQWLAAAGLPALEPRTVLEMESAIMVNQAAIEGLGVAVAIRELVHQELARGTLVCPFAAPPEVTCQFYLVAPEHALFDPRLAALHSWLASDALVASENRTNAT